MDEDAGEGTSCIAHDAKWRSRFQCILNQIRTCRSLDPMDSKGPETQSFCSKVTTAVCTCVIHPTRQIRREPDIRWDSITEQQFEAAEKYFEEYIQHVRDGNSSVRAGPTKESCQTCAGLLEYQYRHMRQELRGSSSARRFLYLFERAVRHKDKELLSRPRKRPTQNQNADPRVRVTIHLRSLKPDLIPLFLGSRGHNMKRYLRGKKKVKVEMKAEGDDVTAIVECKEQDHQTIKQVLEREAELLAERRRIHERNVREYNEQQGMDINEEENEEQSME